ncbi:MAG: cytochrome c family protein [Pirellulales bacterium]|nr:cytochrome c family protein [Pirellulales bacterium]
MTMFVAVLRRLENVPASGWSRKLPALLLVGLGSFVWCLPAAAQQWDVVQDIDPNHVVGHSKCVECHQSEVAAWEKSSHATKAWSLLEKGEAKKIAENLDIADVTADQRCTTCHGTQQQASNLKAVSCESCHGAAGGDKNWLEAHHFFGEGLDPKDPASREQESEEKYRARLAECDRRGMRRSENLYALAKNCLECHTVPYETLVNQGQHPTETKGFEFFEFSQGEIRHNFQQDPLVNAEASTLWLEARFADGKRTVGGRHALAYVVGQLASLEVSLRSRATASGRGKFLTAVNKRILAAQGALEDIHKEAAIQEIQEVLEASKGVKRSSLRKVTPEDGALYNGLADTVAKAGQKVAATYDGNDWSAVDVPKKQKGKAHQP